MVFFRQRSMFYGFILLISIVFMSQIFAQNPPKDWRKIKDWQIIGDRIKDGAKEGPQSLQVGFDSSEIFQGFPSYKITIENAKAEDYWFVMVTLNANWTTIDLTDYLNTDGSLEFNVKGKTGDERFIFSMVDRMYERQNGAGTEASTDFNIGDGSIADVTTEWNKVSLPLSEIFTDGRLQVPEQAFFIKIAKDKEYQADDFTIWLNNMKITTDGKERSWSHIKVNQAGYLPECKKTAYVTGFEDQFFADETTTWELINQQSGKKVLQGNLQLLKNYDQESGERIFFADFSEFKKNGNYFLKVNEKGVDDSPVFEISDQALAQPLKYACRYFYMQRLHQEISEPFAEGYPRKMVHADAAQTKVKDSDIVRNMIGKGWMDAGDQNIYITTGSICVNDLLFAYEFNPGLFTDGQMNIPESDNGIPDLLDEIKVELLWIMEMQADNGGFYDRYHSKGYEIENDISTPGTGDAVSALAHAAIVFANVDPQLSKVSLEAAKKGWAFLQATPQCIPLSKGNNFDSNDFDARFSAAAALYRKTGESVYHDFIIKNIEKLKDNLNRDAALFFDKTDYHGCLNYLLVDFEKNELVLNWFEKNYSEMNEKIFSQYKDHPWKIILEPGNYYWGCNMQILANPGFILKFEKLLFGKYNPSLLQAQFEAIDFVLGRNAVATSFLTGIGERSQTRMFHSFYLYDGLKGIPKGYLAGGINKHDAGAYSNFPGKCWADVDADWTVSENQVIWNSALIFALAVALAEYDF